MAAPTAAWPASREESARSALALALLALHAGLCLWAVHAWSTGPFRGAPVADGAALLSLARTGRGDVIGAASPLFAWLLGRLLTAADGPWTIGLPGLLSSLAVLWGIHVLGRRVCPRAWPWAMGLYVLSGGPLALVPQPLPVLAGTALLLWGVIALHAAREGALRAALAGALLATAVALLAGLLPAALLIALTARVRRLGGSWTRLLALLGGALATGIVISLLLPGSFLPEGWALELRLGNGGARSGLLDLQPGAAATDRLRLEPVTAAYEAGAAEVGADAFHRARLAAEWAADPTGGLLTLLRKLLLFWQRTEIVAGADFRHGLQTLPPLPWLLLSYGLVAPLALASLRQRRDLELWAPAAGVLLTNVLFSTGAAQRLPALPFLCIAAGTWFTARPAPRDLLLVGALALLLNVNWTGADLLRPGLGPLQEGELLLSQDYFDQAAEVLTRADELGGDPRADYLLGVACERAVTLHGDLSLRGRAEHWYRRTLEREPRSPGAADGLMRVLNGQQRAEEALSFGEAYVAEDPEAGSTRLTLAAFEARLQRKDRTRTLLVEGNLRGALWALAHGDREGALLCATELQRMNARDRRLDRLIEAAAH